MLEGLQAPPPDATSSGGGNPPGISRIESPEQLILLVSLAVLTVAIVWGVLSRYVVETPAVWVPEIARLSFAWLVFIGAAEVHRRKMHVGVDIFTSALPANAQRPLAFLIEAATIIFCTYAAYLGALQAIASLGAHTSILRLPLWTNFLAVVAGFGFMAARGIRHLIGYMPWK